MKIVSASMLFIFFIGSIIFPAQPVLEKIGQEPIHLNSSFAQEKESTQPGYEYPEYIPGEVVVKFKEPVVLTEASNGRAISNLDSINKLLNEFGVSNLHRVFYPQGLVEKYNKQSKNSALDVFADLANIYLLKFSHPDGIRKVVDAFAADPNVVYAEPNFIAHTVYVPNDPLFPDQWGPSKVLLPETWDITRGSAGIAIAIIDTGIDMNHPDLASKLWVNPGETPNNGIDDDANGQVDDINGWNFVEGNNTPQDGSVIGHGSHVAGITAAATNNGTGIAGACPNCRIMPVKSMDNSGQGTYTNIAAGITYAAQKGARVINLSLGGFDFSQLLHDAVANASLVSVIVAAAGNQDKQAVFYPAGYDEYVIAVGATDPFDQKASFSNHGSWVDIMAPGVSIWSTINDDGYDSLSGTSMSAPLISGIAGLVYSSHFNWSANAIRAQLLHTTQDIDALNPGYAGLLGNGRVNSLSAMTTAAVPEFEVTAYTLNGNANAVPIPGSTNSLVISLKNWWADGGVVTASLSTTDPYVTVTDAIGSFGSIPSYSVAANAGDLFEFSLAAGIPYDHPIQFNLSINALDGAYTTEISFTIFVSSWDVNVSGVISGDTTWTSDRRYFLTSDVIIETGATLTIDPGTFIRSDGKKLIVRGALAAEGTEVDIVGFSDSTITIAGGQVFLGWCAINNAEIYPAIQGISPGLLDIHNCQITAPIYTVSGYTRDTEINIRDSTIANTSITIDEIAIVNFNRLNIINTKSTISLSSLRPSSISNSRFFGGGGDALVLQMPVGTSVTIAGNIFSNYRRVIDISSGGESSSFSIKNNTFINNITVIRQGWISLDVQFNNFINTSSYALQAYCSSTTLSLNTSNNYWGTTDTALIDQMIYDQLDNGLCLLADYDPILTQPDPDAPAFLSNMTLSPPSPLSLGETTVTLEFSRPMSTTVPLQATFGLISPYTAHSFTGDWISPTQWQGNYTVTHYTGEGTHHLLVSGAKDSSGMTIPDDPHYTFQVTTAGTASTGAEPGYGFVTLDWAPSDMPTAAGYNVYRATISGGPYTRINSNLLIDTTFTDNTVTNGTTYYYQIRLLTTDLAELGYGDEVSALPNDYTAPSMPVVIDDGICTGNSTALHAQWSAVDPESGIAEYQYGIGSFPGFVDVINWTSTGTVNEILRTGLNLLDGIVYYFTVKARNGVGAWGNPGSSDGITVDSHCPTPTPTITLTQTPTLTFTPTLSPTPTSTSTNTPTSTETSTPTFSPTSTLTQTGTPTPTQTTTPTPTHTDTPTATETPTQTSTNTPTPTQTLTQTPTPTIITASMRQIFLPLVLTIAR